jgi:DNA-binding NarL/FixJ family response regulator
MTPKKDVTIVVADDHPMLLKGLYEELTINEYNVIGQANNGVQALELILKEKPTLVILDIDMPYLTGLEVIKTVKEKKVDTKFIILSFHKEADYVAQAKQLQIEGYLLKEDSFFEIERCIETVLNGGNYFSTSFKEAVLKGAKDELQKLQLLTPSERTILKLIAQQTNTNTIADTLCVSVRTIEKHRSNIIFKLGLENSPNTLTNWSLVNKNIILGL